MGFNTVNSRMICKCGGVMNLIEAETLTYQCPVCGKCDMDIPILSKKENTQEPELLNRMEKLEEGELEWRRALIVVDMQNDFINGKLMVQSPKGMDVVRNVCDIIYKVGISYDTVIATVDCHRPQDFRDGETLECCALPEHCLEYSNGMAIHKDVYDALQELIGADKFVRFLKKSTFTTTELAGTKMAGFHNRENTAIDIVGLCTDVCVISTALMLRSEFPKAKIRVIEDACAGTSDKAHECALEVMDSCLIGKMTTEQLIQEAKEYAK